MCSWVSTILLVFTGRFLYLFLLFPVLVSFFGILSWPSPFHWISLWSNTQLLNCTWSLALCWVVRTSSSAPTLSGLHPSLLFFRLFHLPLFPDELNLTSEFCIGWTGPMWPALWIPTEFYFLLASGIICHVGLGPIWATYLLCDVSCLNLYLLWW